MPQVRGILAEYQIGRLKGGAAAAPKPADPYAHEPERLPALIVRSQKPMNSGERQRGHPPQLPVSRSCIQLHPPASVVHLSG